MSAVISKDGTRIAAVLAPGLVALFKEQRA